MSVLSGVWYLGIEAGRDEIVGSMGRECHVDHLQTRLNEFTHIATGLRNTPARCFTPG